MTVSVLESREILSTLLSEVQQATDSVQLISAYLKKPAFVLVNDAIGQNVREKKLLVRMRLDDILRGSSDFEAVEYAYSNGWKVALRFDLHAKTYIVDNKRCILGSANLTNSGLALSGHGNAETATLFEMDEDSIEKVNHLYSGALIVNDRLLSKMKEEIQASKEETSDHNNYRQWSSDITRRWEPNILTLFSYEFPDKKEYEIGEYIPFLDCNYYSTDQLTEALRWSNAFLWLEQLLKQNDGCLYFGKITAELHNTLVSDPKPYRKDVKLLLSNLLGLIEALNMEGITIDTPNYSQRITLN